MSFALTTQQIRDRSKTVTRRLGWSDLKAGELLMACEKVMGRGKGEPLKRLAIIRVKSVRREPLNFIRNDDVRREGFPEMNRYQFIAMFGKSMKCLTTHEVTRIEFEYIPGGRIDG